MYNDYDFFYVKLFIGQGIQHNTRLSMKGLSYTFGPEIQTEYIY